MKFEEFVEQWTGRDMDYHHRVKTTGLDFARACWEEAQRVMHPTCNLRYRDLRSDEEETMPCLHIVRGYVSQYVVLEQMWTDGENIEWRTIHRE